MLDNNTIREYQEHIDSANPYLVESIVCLNVEQIQDRLFTLKKELDYHERNSSAEMIAECQRHIDLCLMISELKSLNSQENRGIVIG